MFCILDLVVCFSNIKLFQDFLGHKQCCRYKHIVGNMNVPLCVLLHFECIMLVRCITFFLCFVKVSDQDQTSNLDNSKECAGSDLEVTIRDHVAPRRSTFDANEVKPVFEKSQNMTKQACTRKGPTSALRSKFN